MKSEVRKRKNRFWAFCLTVILLFGSIMPTAVYAGDTYTDDDLGVYGEETENDKVSILKPDDKVKLDESYTAIYLYYYVGEELCFLDYTSSGENEWTVSNYNEINDSKGEEIPEDELPEGGLTEEEQVVYWKITKKEVDECGGSKYLVIHLQAINVYNINYELDGGENGSNSETYYDGEGVNSFAAATKEGYTFEGWYSDADYTTKVESISADTVGDVTLYAKFTVNNYNITYELNGGTNGENPSGYTYGAGVTSFAAATKEGYTFDGWYSDEDYTTKVESISATQIGDVKLYAKFTQNDNKGKVAWDEIVEKIRNAKNGDKIIIDMNGETILPKDILSEIKGRDIDIVLDMGNGFIWTINGMTVTDPKDVDMGVSMGSGIPVKVINLLTGDLSYITITLAHDGDFGFTAVLTVDMGEENNGLYANLYYYNESNEAMEFVSSGLIGKDGNAQLTFTHASEYVILIDIYDHGAKKDVDTDIVDTGDNYADSKVIIIFAFAAIAIVGFTVASKKRKIS